MPQLILIAHNLRSSHNVGSLLRTAEGLGLERVCLTGYTPYPRASDDERLPHLSQKIDKQIAKTALGAEKLVSWQHYADISQLIGKLKSDDYQIVALEQAVGSIKLFEYKPPRKLAIIVGREVEGIESEVLEMCDKIIEIPMSGKKESFNVVQAAAMALYHMTFAL